MKFKLIDVKQEAEFAEFGTCEFCFSTRYLEVTSYVIEGEDGVRHELENGEWSWGEYYYYVNSEVKNVIDFASFLSNQEYHGDRNRDNEIISWFFDILEFYVARVQN